VDGADINGLVNCPQSDLSKDCCWQNRELQLACVSVIH